MDKVMIKSLRVFFAITLIAFMLSVAIVPALARGSNEAAGNAKVDKVAPAATVSNGNAAEAGAKVEPKAAPVPAAAAAAGVVEEKAQAAGGADSKKMDMQMQSKPEGEHGGGVSDENKEVTSLDISKDVDSVGASEPEITLEKTASESEVNMLIGETHDVSFTIMFGMLMDNTYSISGNIFVKNTGDWPALVTGVSDTVWYKAGGPAWLAAGSSISTTVPAVIPLGEHVYSYSGTFTLPVELADVTAMSNLIEITISNHAPPPGFEHTFHFREDFAKPVAGEMGMLELSDIETIMPAVGLDFVINSVTINGADAAISGPWDLDPADAPFTVIISKTLTANAAGDYLLHNVAMVGELADEADIIIHVETEVTEEANGVINGTKFEDLNGNGIADLGEPGLAGVIIMLSGNGMDLQAVTGLNGGYLFDELPAGAYVVSEMVPDGFYATSPISVNVDLAEDETETVDFLNARFAAIGGFKYLDVNGNGALDEGENGLGGVTIELRDSEGVLIAITVTAADGSYAFMGLMAGDYSVMEVLPSGFEATGPVSADIALMPGEAAVMNFFNREIPVPVGPLGPPTPGVTPTPGVVTPEAEVAPEEEVAPQELPQTGLELTYFLVAMALLIFMGISLATRGLWISWKE